MPIVSELIEKRKKKQKESVNAIGRGNVLGVVKETEAVTPTVEEEGTEIENASVIVASRIEIMIVEVGEDHGRDQGNVPEIETGVIGTGDMTGTIVIEFYLQT